MTQPPGLLSVSRRETRPSANLASLVDTRSVGEREARTEHLRGEEGEQDEHDRRVVGQEPGLESIEGLACAIAECQDSDDWNELDAAFATNCDPLTGKYPRDPLYDRLFTKIVMTAPEPIGLGSHR